MKQKRVFQFKAIKHQSKIAGGTRTGVEATNGSSWPESSAGVPSASQYRDILKYDRNAHRKADQGILGYFQV